MRILSTILFILSSLFFASAIVNISKGPQEVGYIVGSFLPGVICLALSLKVVERHKRSSGSQKKVVGDPPELAEDLAWQAEADNARVESFKFQANLGVGGGILLMFFGMAVGGKAAGGLLAGTAIYCVGWAWLVWGCVNYARWKGRSGWFGLMGYLVLPGILYLAWLPNRRKSGFDAYLKERTGGMSELSLRDHKPGGRYLLALIPAGVVFIGVVGLTLYNTSNIPAAGWAPFTPVNQGFQASMPGRPRHDHNVQTGPNGVVEVDKYSVEPQGKGELFMIMSIRFPEELVEQIGEERLMDLSRQDLIAAAGGTVMSEKTIDLNGFRGREVELLLPQGGIVKTRMFVTKRCSYQVTVQVSKARRDSEDVHRFFDGFQLLTGSWN